MRSLSYTTKFIGAFFSRFKGIIAVAAIMGVGLFLVLRFLAPVIFVSTYTVGFVGAYHPDNLPEEIQLLISDGLTTVDETGEVGPALATRWEETDQGRKWTFHLDGEKTWQDDKKITASAINYNFTDVVISRPDEKTLVFELETPLSPFPSVVAKPVFKKGLLGTGDWKVSKLTLAGPNVEKLVLTNASGSRQIIKFYPTQERAKLGFKLGEVDALTDLIDPAPFDTWETVQIDEQIARDRFVAVFFNSEDPFLADKSARQALSYAIDKNHFANDRAIGPISPLSWAANPQVKPYLYDQQRAQELLERIGEVKLVTTTALLPVAEKIAADWRAVEVDTAVQVTSLLPADFQAFLVIYDIPKDPDQYSAWHSSQEAGNIANYSSPRIDKLLEDGRLELNQDKRREIYLDFQRFLLEDAPAAFLYHPSSYTITRK